MSFLLSRRALLAQGAAFGAVACAGETAAPAAVRPIGIQLYTLRTLMEQDLPGTLGRLAEIGYKEVEFAGYFDTPPAEVKTILDGLGLTAPSAHVPINLIRDTPQELIAAAQAVGHQYLVMPWLAEADRRTLDQYRAVADTLNAFAVEAQAAGIKVAYHNHDFEFQPIDGVKPYDLLLERADPALVQFELDLFWAVKAGEDPIAILTAAPERFPMAHVKDMTADGAMADVGAGTIDFAAIFAAHPFAHYFVEHDNPTDAAASAAASFTALSGLLAAR